MANASDIDAYHNHLLAALNDESLLGQRATIRHTPSRNWKNKRFKGPIDFDLWPTAMPMWAESDRGGELAVFAFEKLKHFGAGELVEIEDEGKSGNCWISWHERWDRLVPPIDFPGKESKQPHFMLDTIQWILFWGQPDPGPRVQIVRAEWDNAVHVARKKLEYNLASGKGEQNSEAGQPHWHVDRVLELGDVDAYLNHRDTELQELAYGSYAGQYLNLKRVHLAMGGWKNGAESLGTAISDAARWQIKYTEDRDELIEWNLSTLRYIKSQTQYFTRYRSS
jgi:hypothetical protein